MRLTHVAQTSIFEQYCKHQFGTRLKALSEQLDRHPEILSLVAEDLIFTTTQTVGRNGISVESVFRCLLLKQQLSLSYEQLAFHLCDSQTYRTFARLPPHVYPSRSGLQATVRKVRPETLEKIHIFLAQAWHREGVLALDQIRIDSTVVASNIASPSDSQLLNDGVRVLSRLLSRSKCRTDVKLRFTDQRKQAKSLAFRIFNAKSREKEVLYPKLIKVARLVLKQADSGLDRIKLQAHDGQSKQKWLDEVTYYRDLTSKVIAQTERRVVQGDRVPSAEKVVSLFEPHTDIIIKGYRDVEYGHKINLSSERSGLITHLSIEEGNPSDTTLYLPVLRYHGSEIGCLPESVVADGGYASQENVEQGRRMGIKRVVFHKKAGISLKSMGVKEKTFKRLRDFRAGIEGNISELKRAFGAAKAQWKGYDGFKAYVWASVISYNLARLARISPS